MYSVDLIAAVNLYLTVSHLQNMCIFSSIILDIKIPTFLSTVFQEIEMKQLRK